MTDDNEITRRRLVTATLASGFALAVRPVHSATITTDSTGLTAGEVRIPVKDGAIPAYRAMPESGSPFPVVLVVQEIFGVHEHIRDLCRRLAKLGYLAIAPDLFVRQGDVSTKESIDAIRPIVAAVPDAQVMSDLDAAVAWARNTRRGDLSRLGVTGFCWGGRITWLYAAHSTQLKAGVAWYGRLTSEATALQPGRPVELAAQLRAPVLGLYGGKDTGIPLSSVEEMKAALEKAQSPSKIVVFPDAPHGFLADYRPSYTPDAAAEGWKQMLAWFRTHGVA